MERQQKSGKNLNQILKQGILRQIQEDEPFKINLRLVGDRTKVKQKVEVEDKYHQSNSVLISTDLHQLPKRSENKEFIVVNKYQKEIHSLTKSERLLVLEKSYETKA